MNKHQHSSSTVDESLQQPQEINDFQDKYVRALADYQNLVRQHQKERQEYLKYATQSLIIELMPILDSLDLSQKHSQDPGVAMITKQLRTIIESQGVSFINPDINETFNPQIHECIDIDSSTQGQPETISQVLQPGAQWQDGQVIRPAQVVVFRQIEETADIDKKPVDSA